MALQLNDLTAVINRTTNLVAAVSDYTACVWFRTTFLSATPDYIAQLAIIDAGYTAWAGVFSNASISDGTTQISISNGGPPTGTPEAAIVAVATLVHLAYVRSGTTHTFYRNGVLVGSVTNDLSAVTLIDMLLGNDGFSVIDSPIRFEEFREWDAALTAVELAAEMASSVAVRTANLITDTPLDTDLLDISGNGNDWSGVGDFEFVTVTEGTRVTQQPTIAVQAAGVTRVTQAGAPVVQAAGVTRVSQLVAAAAVLGGGMSRVTQMFAFTIMSPDIPPELPAVECVLERPSADCWTPLAE